MLQDGPTCVRSRKREGGCAGGSCWDSPGSECERSHKSSRRGAGFTLITIIRYFSLSLPLTVSSLSPALAQWALPLSFDPWKQLVMVFFEEFDAQRNMRGGGEKSLGNGRPLSDLDFGSLGKPQGVDFFLLGLVSLSFCFWDLFSLKGMGAAWPTQWIQGSVVCLFVFSSWTIVKSYKRDQTFSTGGHSTNPLTHSSWCRLWLLWLAGPGTHAHTFGHLS